MPRAQPAPRATDPAPPHPTRPRRALADGDLVVTEVEMPQDHVLYRAVSLWTVRDGEIVGAREYRTSPGQDPAPHRRAGYVEPLAAD